MAKEKAKVTELKPINRKRVTVRIIGISPLVQHQWPEKAKEMMRQKQQAGKKTKDRDLRDPQAEGESAIYKTPDGAPGILAVSLKSAIIEAAHQDLGVPKTLVRKSLFILPFGRQVVLPLETPTKNGPCKYEIVEDMVRVGQGKADLRYRPYFDQWAVTTQWELDADLLQTEDLLKLIDRAGFGVGIHERRPETGGEYGRFRIDPKFEVLEEQL